jgi:hypothetical protein
MPNQLKQATRYLFSKIVIRQFQALSAHLYQHDPNDFCSRDYLKVFKHDSKN